MPEGIMLILFFVGCGIVYWIVSALGNTIVDKGSDAIENAYKRKKNARSENKMENLSDRYRQ